MPPQLLHRHHAYTHHECCQRRHAQQVGQCCVVWTCRCVWSRSHDGYCAAHSHCMRRIAQGRWSTQALAGDRTNTLPSHALWVTGLLRCIFPQHLAGTAQPPTPVSVRGMATNWTSGETRGWRAGEATLAAADWPTCTIAPIPAPAACL